MRGTKTFLGIFLVTFVIGCISVVLSRKVFVPETTNEIRQVRDQQVFPAEIPVLETEVPKPKIQPKFEPEIVIDTEKERITKYKMELLEVGWDYDDEDVNAKPGEIWLGFFKEKNKYFLRSEKLKVRKEKESGSPTIAIGSKIEPVVLIGKDKNFLRDGEVKTLFSQPSTKETERLGRDDSLLKSGFVRRFNLGEKKYALKIKQAVDKTGDRFLALVLELGKKSQIVTYTPYFDESDYSNLQVESYLGNLVWVGDLDRDGELDFYLDDNTFEKGYSRTLYLSSPAKKGELITDVAEIWAGC